MKFKKSHTVFKEMNPYYLKNKINLKGIHIILSKYHLKKMSLCEFKGDPSTPKQASPTTKNHSGGPNVSIFSYGIRAVAGL